MMKSLWDFFRAVLPRSSIPKRQRAGALQDASLGSFVISQRASVLECGGPPTAFPRHNKICTLFQMSFRNRKKKRDGVCRPVREMFFVLRCGRLGLGGFGCC